MAKQKEIKFRRDGKLFYGQQNGVKYSIHEARRLHEDESEQYYVSVNYPNERHRSFTTNGYRTFDLDGAKAFCQQSGKRPLWNTPRSRRQRFRGSWTHTGSTSAPYWSSSTVMSCMLAIRPDCCSQNGNSKKRSLTPIKTPYSANSLRESTPVCTVTRSTRIAAPSSRTWWLISWLRAA